MSSNMSGLRIHVDGGVVVDKFTRTGAADVFAAGDVAVTLDPVTGAPMVKGMQVGAIKKQVISHRLHYGHIVRL
jgi:NADPH-dependent 2,4-dienoyl-CoA reductase/sulfur reductase-like enzyme